MCQSRKRSALIRLISVYIRFLKLSLGKYFKANLCYMETAWEWKSDNIRDSSDSDRHHIEVLDWIDLQEKVRP